MNSARTCRVVSVTSTVQKPWFAPNSVRSLRESYLNHVTATAFAGFPLAWAVAAGRIVPNRAVVILLHGAGMSVRGGPNRWLDHRFGPAAGSHCGKVR